MERNTNTTVGELKVGDRFYRATGKDRTVLEVVSLKPKAGGAMVKKDTEVHPWLMKNEVAVVFLRHKDEGNV